MTRARVVLADDHAIFLQGLQHILQSEFEVVATASDGTSLIDEVLRHKPEVAVADLAMPEVDGLEALRQLKQHSEVSTRFVFLTASPDVPSATQAFRLGAHAYVLKWSASDELVIAIRCALAGQTYITPRIASDVLRNLMEEGSAKQERVLTARECEVLRLIAEGRSAKDIAAALNISPRTIEFHRQNISEKTGLKSIAELARYAYQHGLVPELI